MKALITLLIIGSSSVALARPITVDPRYDATTNGVIVRDQRDIQLAPAPAYDRYDDDDDLDGYDSYDGRFDDRDHRYGNHRPRFQRPVLLASNVSMMRHTGRDHRPMLIDLPSRTAGLKTIRLERNEGRMFIDEIVVLFTDGHQQTVEVNQVLSARQPTVSITLDHGAPAAITVHGTTMRRRATFDVIGLRR